MFYKVDIKDEFNFSSHNPFLPELDFKKYFIANGINRTYDNNEFKKYIINEYIYSYIDSDKYFTYLITHGIDSMMGFDNTSIPRVKQFIEFDKEHENFIAKNIFKFLTSKEKLNIYPNWQLFYMSLNNTIMNNHNQNDFKAFIPCFEKMTDILFKQFYIQNINDKDFKHLLQKTLNTYSMQVFSKDEILNYFKYLIELHYLLKTSQYYKLMWNLEYTYIKAVIDICLKNSIEYSTLEELTRHRQIPYLYTIYRGNDFKYFESQSHYFSGVINYFEKYEKLSKDKCFKLLFSNEKYFDTLHTIIELNEETFKNKYKYYILTSLIRGIVLNIEELIKDRIKDNKDFFEEKIKLIEEKESEKNDKTLKFKYFDLIHYLQILSDDIKVKKIQSKLEFANVINKHERYSKQIKFLSRLHCKEKYFLIFQKTRNYVAHNHIDFKRLFNSKAIHVSSILDSIIFIFIYLEMLKNKVGTTK